MRSRKEADYRLKLAEQFCAEAERAFGQGEWRSCVRSCRDGVENAAKAVIAYFEPVEKSHNPDRQLSRLLEQKLIDRSLEKGIRELVGLSAEMGMKKHILIQYGDEETFRDPWQFFDRASATAAIESARKSVEIGRRVYEHYTKPSSKQ